MDTPPAAAVAENALVAATASLAVAPPLIAISH
jgi:hypothetical protein